MLLTGRTTDFAELIDHMLVSLHLNFDLLVLKPNDLSPPYLGTLEFKLQFLDQFWDFAKVLKEIVIYEDRPVHCDAFSKHLTKWTRPQTESLGATREIESARHLEKFEIKCIDRESTRRFLPENEEKEILRMLMNIENSPESQRFPAPK